MARSNLIPNGFIWENLEIFILLFLFILARNVKPNETIFFYKYQMSS